MKIRTGFVSNSSGSSFILVYLPPDFDFDIERHAYIERARKRHEEYYKKFPVGRYSSPFVVPEEMNYITERDIIELRRRGRVYQQDSDEKYSGLYQLLSPYSLLHVEVQEEAGWIKLADKDFFGKKDEFEKKVKENNSKYYDEVIDKKIRRETLRHKMKHVDPYEEEDWDD